MPDQARTLSPDSQNPTFSPTPRPERRNPYQITPSAYQEIKMHDAPRPAAVVALDAYDVKVIQEYRAAKEAWDKARETADANAKQVDYIGLWNEQDMAAVERAHEALRACEMVMAMMFDYMAKKAGV